MGSESFHMSTTRSLSILAVALAAGAAALAKLTDDAAAAVVPLNLHDANAILIQHAADAAELAQAVADHAAVDVSALADRVTHLETILSEAGINPTAPAPAPAAPAPAPVADAAPVAAPVAPAAA
jgi:biopolymer transport protein ExbB